MNNQQKLVALAGITTVAVISLLLYLNSRRRKKCQDSDGIPNEDDELEFADLTASAAVASASETVVQVKVPQYAVGAIIGKGGQSIRQLKKETGTRWVEPGYSCFMVKSNLGQATGTPKI